MGRPRRTAPRWTSGLAVAVALAGCGDVGEPDLGVAPTGPLADATVTEPPVAGDAPERADPSAAGFAAQLTPNRPADFVPEVLVADDTGVRVQDGPVLLPGLVADRVVDDPTGGLVVQVPTPAGRQIVWFPASTEAGQVLAEGEDRLMDVAFSDGTVHAVVTDGERVALLRLDEPEEQVLTTVEPDTTVASVSAAAGRYALVVEDAACGSLQFRRADGSPVDVAAVPPSPCQTPGRAVYGLVAFSPAGDTFAYTERTFRSDGVVAATDLVVRDLAGVELHRSQIGGEGQSILALAFDDPLVAVLRQGPALPEVARLDLRRPEQVAATAVEGARAIAFTRVPRSEP